MDVYVSFKLLGNLFCSSNCRHSSPHPTVDTTRSKLEHLFPSSLRSARPRLFPMQTTPTVKEKACATVFYDRKERGELAVRQSNVAEM